MADATAALIGDIAVHDFDEIGVPDDADLEWRQRSLELWIRRAVDYQMVGIDLLLTGQSPLGEVLAAPSADRLDGIAVYLVDVADETRRQRRAQRDPAGGPPDAVEAFTNWTAWHRQHAADPRHRPDVLTAGSWPRMAWHRWTAWSASDPQWCTRTLDTTDHPIAASIAALAAWVVEQRDLNRVGTLPLAPGWAIQR